MEVRWIKLAIDIFDNRKIRQIEKMPDGDALLVIWLKMLVLAGTVNDGGLVYFTRDIPYTDQLLANQFDKPLATVQLALQTFEQFGMIERVDDLIHVSNWERYQNIDGLEKIREQNRLAAQRYRDRKKLASHDASHDDDVTVTQHHDTDKIREDKNRTEKKRFTPPTLEEVSEYCSERKNGIDPQRFIDYYAARGWELKPGQKVKDWRACVRTWESRNKQAEPKRSAVTSDDRDRIKRFLGGVE